MNDEALVLAATLCAGMWFLFGGFFFNLADITFAYEAFGHVKSEQTFVLLTVATTALKYGLPLAAFIVFLLLREGKSGPRLIQGMLLVLHVKLALLLVQILVGALGTREKLFELAIMDLVFVACLFAFVVLVYGTSRGLGGLWRLGTRLSTGPGPSARRSP